jgi:membrane-bound lytic murein transglycosylase D
MNDVTPTNSLSSILVRATLVLTLAVTVGCATKSPPQAGSPVLPAPEPTVAETAAAEVAVAAALTEVDHRLADGMYLYRRGIALLAEGDEIDGEERIARASIALREGLESCAATPECDLPRFLDGIDTVMTEQNLALKQLSYRIATLEAEREPELEQEQGTVPVVEVLPELGKTVAVLRGTDLRELIEMNAPIDAALNDWLTWMRPQLMASHENYRYLRSRIAPVYEEAGLPEALLFAMMATESGGKAHAVSRAGASGLLQFMRYTGAKYGLGKDGDFDTRFDPVMATQANVAYLGDRFAELNDELPKVLAAYNGGEGRLANLHRKYPGASLWDARIYWSLPKETREYVPRILAAAWLFLHPAEYGLEFPGGQVETTFMALEREASIGELTICLGQTAGTTDGWFRTLRNLNPRVDPSDRMPAGTLIELPSVLVEPYRERCLDGDLIARAIELHDADYPENPEMIVYTVRRGDTLSRIAEKFQCTNIRQIAAINDVRPPRYVIGAGQRLKIPPCN